MTDQMTDERLAEIREWRDELGASRKVADGGPYAALRDAVAETERLRAALAAADRAEDQALRERDDAQEMADKLAYAIAPMEVIGEHSSGNCPWENALEIAEHHAAEVARLRAEVSRAEAGMEAVLALSDDPNGMVSIGQIARAYQQGRHAAKGEDRG